MSRIPDLQLQNDLGLPDSNAGEIGLQLVARDGISSNTSIGSIARDYELPFFNLPTRHQQLLPPQLYFPYTSGSSEPRDIGTSPSLLRLEQLSFDSDYILDESHGYSLGDINNSTYERVPLSASDPTDIAAPQIVFGQSEFNDISDNIYRGHPIYADVFNGTTSSPQLFPGLQFDAITGAEPFYNGTLDGIASLPPLGPQLGGIEDSIYGNENPYATFANAIASPQLLALDHGVGSNVFDGAVDGGEQNGELAQPVLEPRHAADIPTPPDNEVNTNEGTPSSQGGQCGDNCRGDIISPHQCVLSETTSQWMISCRRNNCRLKFKLRNDFYRHCQTLHTPIKLIDCPHRGCKRVGAKGFNAARPDNLLQHRRTKHKENIEKVPVRFARGSKNVRSREYKFAKALEEGREK